MQPFEGEPLSKAWGGVGLIGSVPSALCVECLVDFSGGRVTGHVTVSVGMNSGVRIAWVIVEDASVLYGGWSREEKGDVRRLD